MLDFADSVRELAEVQSPVSTNMLIEFERHVRRWGVEAASVLFCNHFDDDEVGPVQRALEAHSLTIEAEVYADDEAPTPVVEGETHTVASEMVG